jgi:hypothetical protein
VKATVTHFRSAQARYLLALHDHRLLTLTQPQQVLCLRVALAGRERRRLPPAEIQKLSRLVLVLKPRAASRRRSTSPPGASP